MRNKTNRKILRNRVNGKKQKNGRKWTIERKYTSMDRLTKHNTIVTELIYFWTLSKNRLTIVTGKKKIQSYNEIALFC